MSQCIPAAVFPVSLQSWKRTDRDGAQKGVVRRTGMNLAV